MSGSQATLGDVVAANVRAERSRRRWTQEQLGRMLGWSRQVVTSIESGQRQVLVAELPDLCRVLEVPLSRLFTDAEPTDLESLRLHE